MGRKREFIRLVKLFCVCLGVTVLLSLAAMYGPWQDWDMFSGGKGRLQERSSHGDSQAYESADKMTAMAAPPGISAAGAFLAASADGRVLMEQNSDRQLYPASTTKIMTALVALEILDELGLGMDAEVVVPDCAAGVEGSSMGLEAGERLTMEELLYGLMLPSGNDSATAIAECLGPGQEKFVARMNGRAAELGCMNTHFVNPSGLPDDNHYTTARDLCAIAMEAMKREDFRAIAGAKEWSGGTAGRTFTNKNKTVHSYRGATGVKIGYTDEAGRTLVASAKRGDTELVAVVLKDGNWFNDAYAMLDYGFEVLGVGE